MVHLAVGMSRSVGNVSDLFRMETEIMFHCSHVRTYKQTHTCFMISCHTFHTSSYHHVIISSYHQYTYYMHQLINPRKLSNSSAWIFFARLLAPPGRALPGGTSATRLGRAAGLTLRNVPGNGLDGRSLEYKLLQNHTLYINVNDIK